MEKQKKLKILYIVRGLPGSGKSTFSKTLGVLHFEADMYFIDENGEYNFDPANIKAAHIWCQNNIADSMERSLLTEEPCKHDILVVSNTFTQKWEMDPYLELAKKYGYYVFSLVVENRHGGETVHGVPGDSIQRMRDRFEIEL